MSRQVSTLLPRLGVAVAAAVAVLVASAIAWAQTPSEGNKAASPVEVEGVTAAALAVNGSGALNYAIAIRVPPGTVGVEPKVTLFYDSQSGNGLAGVGFAVQGLSAISRCAADLRYDKVIGDISFDDQDRFCLDGQRLVMVEGSAYGDEGSVYHTARETWTRVEAQGRCGTGPCSFTAINKNGWRLEFGASPDARVPVPHSSTIARWHLSHTTDPRGNRVSVSYDPRDGALTALPLEIAYTSNETAGLEAKRHVYFDYDPRPDTILQSLGGQRFELGKRLSAIRTEVLGRPVLIYKLTYDQSAATGRSLLTSVQECAGEACLPPTTIAWRGGGNEVVSPNNDPTGRMPVSNWCTDKGARIETGDFNGDGKRDLFCRAPGGKHRVMLSTANSLKSPNQDVKGLVRTDWCADGAVFHPDFDGDGRTDLACAEKDGVHRVLVSRSDKVVSPTGDAQGTVRTNWCPAKTCQASWGNYNRDGRADLLCSCNDGKHFALLSTGTGLEPPKGTGAEGLVKTNWCAATGGRETQTFWSDFNGDHAADLHCRDQGGKIQVMLATAGRMVSPNRDPEGTVSVNWCPLTKGNAIRSVDFNGDGLSDLHCAEAAGRHSIKLSNGRELDRMRQDPILTNWCAAPGSAVSWADFNGDGRGDLHCSDPNDGAERVMLSTSLELKPAGRDPLGTVRTGWCPRFRSGVHWLDFDGNALADAFCAADDGGLFVLVRKGNLPDLVAEITDGLGGRRAVEYKPVTDDAIYQSEGDLSYPLVDVRHPKYVVTRQELHDGRGGVRANTFRYAGARTDMLLGGRWLGFKRMEQISAASGRKTVTHYRQDDPFQGMPELVQQMDPEGVVQRQHLITYEKIETHPHVFDVLTVEEQTTFMDAGKPARVTRIKRTYDAYGNVSLLANFGDPEVSTDDLFTCTKHINDAEKWRLGYDREQKVARNEDACTRFLESESPTWDAATDLGWMRVTFDDRMNIVATSSFDDGGNRWLTKSLSIDAVGNITRITQPGGQTTDVEFDADLRTFPTQMRSPAPDPQGQPLVISSVHEPAFGNLTSQTDANGYTLSHEHDGFGRFLSTARPLAANAGPTVVLETRYGQDKQGFFVEERRRSDAATDAWIWSRTYRDGLERVFRHEAQGEDPKRPIIDETEFDDEGRPGKRSIPRYADEPARFVEYTYDSLDRPTGIVRPDGRRDTITYLEGGRHRRYVTAAGTDRARTRVMTYDVHGNVVRTEAPEGIVIERRYDPLSRPIEVISGNQLKTEIAYDSMGRKTTIQDPDRGKLQRAFDDRGLLSKEVNGAGDVTEYSYDAVGRVIERRRKSADGNATVDTFHYDEPGFGASKMALTRAVGSNLTQTLAYAPEGFLKETSFAMDGKTYTNAYAHDVGGRLKERTYPAGDSAAYAYDPAGRLATISYRPKPDADPQMIASFAGYGAHGLPALTTYGNGVVVKRAFEQVDLQTVRLTEISIQPPGDSAPITTRYDWNSFDQIVGVEKTGGASRSEGETYSYDQLGRLVDAKGGFGTLAYTYDPDSNLIQRNDVRFEHQPGTSRMIAASDGLRLDYAPDGVVREKKRDDAVWKFSHDPDGRLLEVVGDDKILSRAAFDAKGNRVRREDAKGRVSRYVTSDFDVLAADNKELTTRTFEGPNGLIATVSNGPDNATVDGGYPVPGILYFVSDHRKSIRQVFDASGTVVAELSYTPYGALYHMETSGKDEFRAKFGGKERDDDTGLYDFGARTYDPEIARFLEADPIARAGSSYLFGAADPINNIDPDGRDPVTVTVIVVAAVIGAYSGGAAVTHDPNPLHWNWSKAETYGGIIAGAGLGAAGGAVGSALIEAGAIGLVGELALGAAEGAAFTALGGGNAAEVGESAAFGGVTAVAGAVVLQGLGAGVRALRSRFASSAEAAEANARRVAAYGVQDDFRRQAGAWPEVHPSTMANTSRVSYETNYRRFGIWKVRKRVAFNVINRSAQTRTAITNHLNAIFDTREGSSLLTAIARRGQRRVNIFLQSADNVWAMVYHGDIFLTPGYQVSINVAGSGIRQTESTRRILAHELGHVAFPGRTEQQIVNTVENPIAQRFGWNLRGQY